MLAEPASSLYCQWTVPGQRVAVNLSLGVVKRLGIAIRERTDSHSARRPEIGGFLLGATRRIHSTTIVEVRGIETVECEHAFGASYFLSAADQRQLADRLRHRRGARDSTVVGFFRSNTRREFAPAAEDLAVMTNYFSKPWMPLLLVHVGANDALTGGLCFVEQRAIRTGSPYLQFPFDVDLLQAGQYEIRGWGQATGEERGRATAQTSVWGNGVDRPRLKRASSMLRWPDGWTTLVRSRAVRMRKHVGGIPVAGRQKLAMLCRAAQKPFTSLASSCLFPVTRRFTREWIAVALIFATALFGAMVYHGKRLTRAPTAVARRQRGANRPIDRADASQAAMLPATDVPPQLQPQTAVTAMPGVAPEKSAATVKRSRTESRIMTASRTGTWRAPESIVATSAPPLPQAPDIGTVPEMPLGVRDILASAMPAHPDPFVSVSIDPLRPRRRNIIRRMFSGGRAARTDDFVPPHVLFERWPAIPSEMRTRVRGSVPVIVKLYLDRAGHVDYAELISDGTGSKREFASLAVFATRKWQFSPAQDEGGPVPAEVIVRFRFGPQAAGGTRDTPGISGAER